MRKLQLLILTLALCALSGLCRETTRLGDFGVDNVKLNDNFENVVSTRGAPEKVTSTLEGLGYKASVYNGCKLAIYDGTTVILKEDVVVGVQGKNLQLDSESLYSKGDRLSVVVEGLSRSLGEPTEIVGPSSFPPFETSTSWELKSGRVEIISVDEVVSEVQIYSSFRSDPDSTSLVRP